MNAALAPERISAAFLAACRAEIEALKPGNVHRHSAGHGMEIAHFERAAEAAAGPRIVYSNETAAELTSAIPGAVAFVDATQVPKGLKVLKINGVRPGDKAYPLR